MSPRPDLIVPGSATLLVLVLSKPKAQQCGMHCYRGMVQLSNVRQVNCKDIGTAMDLLRKVWCTDTSQATCSPCITACTLGTLLERQFVSAGSRKPVLWRACPQCTVVPFTRHLHAVV